MILVVALMFWPFVFDHWYAAALVALLCIAAFVGKRFGRHHIEGRLVEGRKCLEGSLAMLVVSFVSVLVVLVIRGGMAWPHLLLTAFVTALVTTVVELVSRHGNDTVTCPLAATAVLIPLTWLLGG